MTIHTDNLNFSMRGEWWDEFHKIDGNGLEYLAHKTTVHKNSIMLKAAKLLTGFLLEEGEGGSGGWSGITYQALGEGDPLWDGSTPPSPANTNEWLEDEYYRKKPAEIVYMTAGGSVYTPTGSKGTPTPGDYQVAERVRIKTVYGYGDANGVWVREQAIFAGDATGTGNTGHIINVIRHNKVEKTPSIQWTRYIQFYITVNS